jgi:hypothetical protein
MKNPRIDLKDHHDRLIKLFEKNGLTPAGSYLWLQNDPYRYLTRKLVIYMNDENTDYLGIVVKKPRT